jgi:hypothetical protein
MADKTPVRKIPLHLIEETADTQSRAELNHEHVQDLADVLRGGGELPPGDIFRTPDSRYLIADNWHRYYAHKEAGREFMLARVHDGDEAGALWFALGSNTKHGLTRTQADKRHAVRRALESPNAKGLSNREVADHVGVSHVFVAQIKEAMKAERLPAQRVKSGNVTTPPAKLSRPTAEVQATLDLDGAAPSTSQPVAVEGFEGLDTGGLTIHVPEPDHVGEPEGPVVDLDQLAAPYRAWPTKLREMRKAFDGLAKNESVGGHLARKITRLDSLVTELVDLIRQNEPLAVCGKCDGTGCQHCARTGFWTRTIVEGQKAKAAK